jgi:putative oxidoreductase
MRGHVAPKRAVTLIRNMHLLGATWAHAGNRWPFTAANGGWEYRAFLTFAAVAQALLGDGRYALVDLI